MRQVVGMLGLIGLMACGGGEPSSGTWLYEGVAVSEDTCNAGDQISEPGGEFYLLNNGDGTFTVDPNDGTDLFDCTLDGGSFNCPERLVESVEDSTFQVTIDVHGIAKGDVGKTSGAGQQIGTVDCTGSGCGSVESFFGTTFPCSVTWDFEIVRLGDGLGDEL